MRTTLSALLLLLCLPAAAGEKLIHDRLELTLPDGFAPAAAEASRPRDLVPQTLRGRALVRLFGAVRLERGSLAERLATLVKSINDKRTLVRRLPRRAGRTTAGLPIAVQGEVTRGATGKTRFSLSFGVATGARIQVVTLLALDREAFAKLADPVARMVQTAALRLPAAKTAPPALPEGSRAVSVFNLTYSVPSEWKHDSAQGVNLVRYEIATPVRYRRKTRHTLRLAVDLQGRVPAEPRALLRNWLMLANLGAPRHKGATVKTTAFEEARLPSGLQYLGLLLREEAAGKWPTARVGYLVYGPGWFLLVGTAAGQNEKFGYLNQAQRKAVFEFFGKTVVPRAWAIAASVRWSADAPKPRLDLARKLIEHKRYSYFSQHNMSAGTMHAFHEKSVSWRFDPDGTCVVHAKSFTGFNDYDHVDPSGGGSLSRPGKKRRARFGVLALGGQRFIVVWRPSGWSSLHSLEFDKPGKYGISTFKGLAIDGLIEGTYYSGKGYQYRK